MVSLTPNLARQSNAAPNSPNGFIPEIDGVIIIKVYPKAPAEVGGLCRLDVITEIGGQRVERADDAQRIIDGAIVGKVSALCMYERRIVRQWPILRFRGVRLINSCSDHLFAVCCSIVCC